MDLKGHVLYASAENGQLPFGIVSNNYERQAICTFIPKKIKRHLIEIEDKRFYNHRGLDFKAISRAIVENVKSGRIVQGGSTITQQLARNLLRNNKRNVFNKIREALMALRIEYSNSKEEILNLYFKNVYYGKNLYGLRSASLYYYKKEPLYLSDVEQLMLLTLLRGPNYYQSSAERLNFRFNKLNNLLLERKSISKNRHLKNKHKPQLIGKNRLHVIENSTIPFIQKNIDLENKSIYTTIDLKIQNQLNEYVEQSEYPLSIVCLSKRGVLGFASSYGSTSCFSLRTNVGSTLKPFLYTFLRDNGISSEQLFHGLSNDLNWSVREVKYVSKYLTISDALFHSNNNAFINACYSLDIEKTLNFLAFTLKRDRKGLYPASILGATADGISLYELGKAYFDFFNIQRSQAKTECLEILGNVFKDRLQLNIENIFLKTGTTNDNKERFAILGNPDLVFAVSRGENPLNDPSKEGDLIFSVKKLVRDFFVTNTDYKWI